MLLFALIGLAAVIAVVVVGRSRMAATYLSFKCRSCQKDIHLAKAESLRRLVRAKEDGTLSQLGERPILCPRCGADQAADWLMHPGTQELLRGLAARDTRKELAQEYVSALYDDGTKPAEPAVRPPANREHS